MKIINNYINIEELLNQSEIESQRLEIKKGWNPEKVLRSICAFANDFDNLNGGYVIIGAEEKDGQIIRPVTGIPLSSIEKIQKELLGICKRIKPDYSPIILPEKLDGKTILTIRVPGGLYRPYQCPETLGKGSEYKYYIRKGPETIEAKGENLTELLQMGQSIPYDDRLNYHASIDDLKLPLIQSYLKETKSKLLKDSSKDDFGDLCIRMQIADRIEGKVLPRNVGLMLFSDDIENFFQYSRIEIVIFQGVDVTDEFTEKIFSGPIDRQIKDALNYTRNNILAEKVIKHPDRAEADRFFNYPYPALEEAIVNAFYHRSYEIKEPIEVRIFQDRIEIVSYPGLDRSLKISDLTQGIFIGRRYRNRRVGEFLKELGLTEGRGTGIHTITRSLLENKSPEPVFITDAERTYFVTILKINPLFINKITHQATHQVTPQATFEKIPYQEVLTIDEKEFSILEFCKIPRTREKIQEYLNLSDRIHFSKRYLNKLLTLNLLMKENPMVKTSPKQRYITTKIGIDALEKYKKNF